MNVFSYVVISWQIGLLLSRVRSGAFRASHSSARQREARERRESIENENQNGKRAGRRGRESKSKERSCRR